MILGRNSPDAETAFTIMPEPLHILPLAAPAAADACVHWLRAIIIYKINHSCLFHSVLSEKHYVLFLLFLFYLVYVCFSWDGSVFYQMIVRFSDVAGLLSSSAHLVCSSRLFTSLVQLACSSRRLTSSAPLLCSSCMPISSSHLVCSFCLIKSISI